jgi:hypothetical protein
MAMAHLNQMHAASFGNSQLQNMPSGSRTLEDLINSGCRDQGSYAAKDQGGQHNTTSGSNLGAQMYLNNIDQ